MLLQKFPINRRAKAWRVLSVLGMSCILASSPQPDPRAALQSKQLGALLTSTATTNLPAPTFGQSGSAAVCRVWGN